VKLRPKLLLVGVWAANDFADAGTFEAWERSGVGGNYMVWRDFGRPERRVPFSIGDPAAGLEAIFRHDVYPLLRRSYLFNLLWALRGGHGGAGAGEGGSTITMPFPDGQRLEMSAGPSDGVKSDSRDFTLLLQALSDLNDLAKAQGARTLMVLQPSFDERGIEYLDLRLPLREAAKAGARLFRQTDGHPNEAGYDLIAQLVQKHLAQHKTAYGLAN
jgi:hypothetical protein